MDCNPSESERQRGGSGLPRVRWAVLAAAVLGLAAGPAWGDVDPKWNVVCRAFRAKRHDVPIYKEADRRSEVVSRLKRSEEVCGIAEAREFVTIFWDPNAPAVTAPATEAAASPSASPTGVEKPSEELPRAFVRTVDLWPPRSETAAESPGMKDWWAYHRQGMVPDDPLFWMRPILSFFGLSPQNAPSQGGAP